VTAVLAAVSPNAVRMRVMAGSKRVLSLTMSPSIRGNIPAGEQFDEFLAGFLRDRAAAGIRNIRAAQHRPQGMLVQSQAQRRQIEPVAPMAGNFDHVNVQRRDNLQDAVSNRRFHRDAVTGATHRP